MYLQGPGDSGHGPHKTLTISFEVEFNVRLGPSIMQPVKLSPRVSGNVVSNKVKSGFNNSTLYETFATI